MKEEIIKASHEGKLKIGERQLSVAVLKDGRRVITQSAIFDAFGRPIRGSRDTADQDSPKLPGLIDAKNLKPFISNELEQLIKPIEYLSLTGKKSTGYNATILPLICDVYLEARNAKRDDGKSILTAKQIPNAIAAEIVVRSLSKVGIIALVDEATGYQYDREKLELQAILQAYISDEILEWQRTFQLSFYKEIFRLWGIPFTAENIRKKPMFIGKLTNELVYKNMPKGTFVLEKLKEKTPKTSGGNYKYKLHQSLTPEAGREALKKVIYSIETLATISDSKAKFKRLVQDRFGQRQIPFDNIDQLDKQPTKQIAPTKFNKTLKGILAVPKPDK